MTIALTHIAGRVGDHNNRTMQASPQLASALAHRLGVNPLLLGEPEESLCTNWDQELAAALPLLRQVAARFSRLLRDGLDTRNVILVGGRDSESVASRVARSSAASSVTKDTEAGAA